MSEQMRRRDLNPGDLFVYLDNPRNHPTITIGELRFVRREPYYSPGVACAPSPRRADGWIHPETLDARVERLTVEEAKARKQAAEYKAALIAMAEEFEGMAKRNRELAAGM